MDLPGETYLFNLSLLAITYAVVSALVMMLRQTMGGKVSNFDIHLITGYVSGGFTLAADAILPPLISLTGAPPAILWGVASGLAAVSLALFLVSIISRRRRSSGSPPPQRVLFGWVLQSLAIVLLAANAVPSMFQGVALFAIALSFYLMVLMWAFVRRIASLLGDTPSEDWDPKRG